MNTDYIPPCVITERGWAGHLWSIAPYCRFRRNTLVECGDTKIIVSTLGNYRDMDDHMCRKAPKIIGRGHSETMAFYAAQDSGPYIDFDYEREYSLGDCETYIFITPDNERGADNKINEMHEKAVQFVAASLQKVNK